MDTTLIIAVAGLGISLIALVLFVRNEFRLRTLFKNGQPESIDEILRELALHTRNLELRSEKSENEIKRISIRLAKSVRNVQTVRYNPFPDAGGNQSFAVALLDDHGNGVVLSSLYARDRMSVYAKPIEMHASEFELSGEELEAVTKAKG